jgi:hypothetical protein
MIGFRWPGLVAETLNHYLHGVGCPMLLDLQLIHALEL